MATLTYRCPVDPAECGESAQPGFCATHRSARLERVRVPFAAATSPSSQAPARPASSPPGPSAGPASGPARTFAVKLLGRLLPVPAGGLLLGRQAPDTRHLPGFADLRHVGREHARLYWHQDALYLVDLGSRNKTFVNGQPITQPVQLVPGETFNIAGDADVTVVELDENGFEVTGRG